MNHVHSGYRIEPTAFAGVPDQMPIAREEILGPVAAVIPFDTAEDAVKLANDTQYGLGGGIWTNSLPTAHTLAEGIKAGTIWVNCYGVLDPNVGFDGYQMSGFGWKGGH